MTRPKSRWRNILGAVAAFVQAVAILYLLDSVGGSPHIKELITRASRTGFVLGYVIFLIGSLLTILRVFGLLFLHGRRIRSFIALPMAVALLLVGFGLAPASGLSELVGRSSEQILTLKTRALWSFLDLMYFAAILLFAEGLWRLGASLTGGGRKRHLRKEDAGEE